MGFGLAGDMFGEDFGASVFEAHDRSRGFIAAGFDPEDGDSALHHCGGACTPRAAE
jgi:hypothetical protein